jgi:hypothetical protein
VEEITIGKENMSSNLNYHEPIQKFAQEVINSRKGVYVRSDGQQLVWNERQICYLYGAIYKLLRIKNEMASLDKARDDLVDAYNYIALFFETLENK